MARRAGARSRCPAAASIPGATTCSTTCARRFLRARNPCTTAAGARPLSRWHSRSSSPPTSAARSRWRTRWRWSSKARPRARCSRPSPASGGGGDIVPSLLRRGGLLFVGAELLRRPLGETRVDHLVDRHRAVDQVHVLEELPYVLERGDVVGSVRVDVVRPHRLVHIRVLDERVLG